MNRRGFLSMLAGAIAAPLVPSGKAFSFLGGIYRPAWEEVLTPWPIPALTLHNGNSLQILEGDRPEDAMETQRFEAEMKGGSHGIAATFDGISMPTLAKLFKDRSGNWKIIRAPWRPEQKPNLTMHGSLTIPVKSTLAHWAGTITFVGPAPDRKEFTATLG